MFTDNALLHAYVRDAHCPDVRCAARYTGSGKFSTEPAAVSVSTPGHADTWSALVTRLLAKASELSAIDRSSFPAVSPRLMTARRSRAVNARNKRMCLQ